VELVVVIILLGILAAVAVPKLSNLSVATTENSIRQSLAVIRDSIARFAVENGGALPGATTENNTGFQNDMAPHLRGAFPAAPLGPAMGDSRVRVLSDGDPLSGSASPARAWKYDCESNEFIFNYNGLSSDGVTRYDEF